MQKRQIRLFAYAIGFGMLIYWLLFQLLKTRLHFQ